MTAEAAPAAAMPSERAGSFRELLAVAIPLVISSGSLALMHVMDRVMLTWLSVDAMAASTPGGMLHWTLISFPYGIAVYTNTFIAQYDGAGKRDRVIASLWQGLLMAAIGGIVLAATVPLTVQLIPLFGHNAHIAQLEEEYFSIFAYGSLPALVNAVLSSFFSGRGRTTVLMVVNFITAIANGFFSYFLIFGSIFGTRWFDGLGISGAAWGTMGAQTLGCLLYIAWMNIDRESRQFPFFQEFRIDVDLLLRMVRYGVPNGMQYVVDVAAYMLLLVFIGRIGTHELAATVLAFNLNSMAFIPIFGFGLAVSTLVGRRIGEGRPELAIRTTWLGMGLAALYTAGWSAIYLFAPDLILAPYAVNAKPEEFALLKPIVVNLLYFVSLYAFFDAMAVVFGSATRGAGDTRFSLVFTGVTIWTVMVLPVWWIWYAFIAPGAEAGAAGAEQAWWIWPRHGGLYACWSVVCVQIIVLGIGFWLRFRGGRWLNMRVIESQGIASVSAADLDAA